MRKLKLSSQFFGDVLSVSQPEDGLSLPQCSLEGVNMDPVGQTGRGALQQGGKRTNKKQNKRKRNMFRRKLVLMTASKVTKNQLKIRYILHVHIF